jgi:hypothetical protein
MWKRLQVQYLLQLPDFNKIWIFPTYFRKNVNIKFNQNPSSRGRVVPCTRTDEGTDLTKLIVTFRNFGNAPNNNNIMHTAIKLEQKRVSDTGNVVYLLQVLKCTGHRNKYGCVYLLLPLPKSAGVGKQRPNRLLRWRNWIKYYWGPERSNA